MARSPKVGDIIEIPLGKGKYGYCQYMFYDKENGPLIQVYNLIDDGNSTIETILKCKPLFPPMMTGIGAAVQKLNWEIIGQCEVENFNYPTFRSTIGDFLDVNAVWFLYDGSSEKRVSPLPKNAWNYELGIVWSPYDVVDRILTGKHEYQLN